MKQQKNGMRWAFIIFMVVLILALTYCTRFMLVQIEDMEERELLDSTSISKEELENTIQNGITEEISLEKEAILPEEEVPIPTERMLQVTSLKKENDDIVGWLEIEGTDINYPVLQGEDDTYYLTHNYKKEWSSKGSIFLSKDYNWEIPSCNYMIHGHNLNNGTMFQELLKYEKESYYQEHPTIRFTTETEDAEYDIISVFLSKVYYKHEKDVFRYYYFIDAKTEEEYNHFIDNIEKASLYPIQKTASYKEQLITLSTCSYHTKDGRFVVVGRKAK